jgi:peptidoglycan/LPS O-acetylase OafA/YrhL
MISVWNVEFMFGMLAAYLLSKYTILLPKILLIFSLICFLFVGKLENQDILDGAADIARLPYGLLSMFILISLVEMERSGHLIVPRIFVLIGEASYSIYLIHLLFIGTAYKVLSYLGLVGELPLAVTLMLVFAAAIVGGVGVSMLLEIPAMNLTRKLLDRLSLPRFFTLRAKV